LLVYEIDRIINETRLIETDSATLRSEDINATIMVLIVFKSFFNDTAKNMCNLYLHIFVLGSGKGYDRSDINFMTVKIMTDSK